MKFTLNTCTVVRHVALGGAVLLFQRADPALELADERRLVPVGADEGDERDGGDDEGEAAADVPLADALREPPTPRAVRAVPGKEVVVAAAVLHVEFQENAVARSRVFSCATSADE